MQNNYCQSEGKGHLVQHFMRVLNNQNGCPTISTELEEHNGISRLNLDNLDKREEINGA